MGIAYPPSRSSNYHPRKFHHMCRPVTTTEAGCRISPGMTRFTGSPCRIRGPLPHPRHGPPRSCGRALRRLHPERSSARGVGEIRGCRPALRCTSRGKLGKHAERVLANPPVAGQRVTRQQVEGSGLPISVGRALRRHLREVDGCETRAADVAGGRREHQWPIAGERREDADEGVGDGLAAALIAPASNSRSTTSHQSGSSGIPSQAAAYCDAVQFDHG